MPLMDLKENLSREWGMMVRCILTILPCLYLLNVLSWKLDFMGLSLLLINSILEAVYFMKIEKITGNLSYEERTILQDQLLIA